MKKWVKDSIHQFGKKMADEIQTEQNIIYVIEINHF
jgi:hypothetical protein